MLKIEQLNFQYSSGYKALDNVDFRIEERDFVSVLGESGSGKSTLLKLIYGLEDAYLGGVFYKGKKVTGPKFNLIPGHAEMKFVPQEFDLLDYVTVAENVGKYLSNFNLPQKQQTIENVLDVVGLSEFKNEFPNRLSGGQRQRVSIARAIAADPKLLLLDEPYSHLDEPLKFELRKNIRNWARENNCSVILTTHDANDALGFSDKMIILKKGKIVQIDSPEKMRYNPVNEYVVSLLGEYSALGSAEMGKIFNIEIPKNKRAVIYPEEFGEDANGAEFQVLDVRFRGRDYLVEAESGVVKVKLYADRKTEQDTIRIGVKKFRII